jgi:hypothetical protein
MDSSLKGIGSRIIGCGALCVVTLLCQSAAFADSVLGITDNGGQLISFDSSNPAGATLLGNLDVSTTPLGLFKNGSSLYVYDINNNVVRQINPATAATISTINIGLPASPGEGDVVFSNGTGFLASTLQPDGSFNGFGTLFSFTLTANSAHVISMTIPFLDGLTVANGTLYGLAQGGAELYTINTSTGTVTPVGATGVSGTFSFGGLTTALDGTLYADLTNFQNATSEFFIIDPATGKATLVGNIAFSRVSGLVDNSTSNGTSPEPSTFFLALSGGLLLAFAFRRKYLALRAQ